MWIKETEYLRLKDCEGMKKELEKEVARLAALISAEVKDCKMGPWCKDCGHFGRDLSVYSVPDVLFGTHVKEIAGEVQYCKKHLHEICPEFERK